jgi:hypothetical protein
MLGWRARGSALAPAGNRAWGATGNAKAAKRF